MATSTTVIEETDIYTAEWDAALDLPVFTWDEYAAGEAFREGARRWEEIIADRGADKYVVNTAGVTAHDDADKRWLAEEWVPDLIDAGVTRGAGVYADSAIASMEMEEVEEQLSSLDPDFEFRAFASNEEAKAWLRDQ
ncbi:hypothetical protein [Halorubrum halophilum]|uniref:hypothetical protein n=1 Tax=Halorubrum halophilum TaxID=413816 RepID=UPI001F15C5A7|nr:hypothetical protein [Halorubrum halophilum]